MKKIKNKEGTMFDNRAMSIVYILSTAKSGNTHMMSKSERTSGEKDTKRKSTTKRQSHGRSDNVCQRFGRYCHTDAVGRFTCSAFFGFCNTKKWAALTNGTEESLLIKEIAVMKCNSENHVPIVAVSDEL